MAEFFELLGFFLGAITYGGLIPNQCCRLSAHGPISVTQLSPTTPSCVQIVSNVILLSAPPTFTDERMRLIVSALSKPPAFSDFLSARAVRNSGEFYLSVLPPSNCAL
jgi:hypothetical protein